MQTDTLHLEFNDIRDVTSQLIGFAEERLPKEVLDRVFFNAVEWYNRKYPGVRYVTPDCACALGIYTEISQHCFDSLGKPRQYWVTDKGGKQKLMSCPDIYALLANSYRQMKFLNTKSK